MELLIAGLLLFFGTHSISIASQTWRDQMCKRLGTLTWQGIYSLLAIAGFMLIINGYADTRINPTTIYTTPNWFRHIAMLLLLPVFPLIIATYLPGKIQTRTKHPMLVATKLWAVSHLMANGNLADVILFSSFLIWAVVERVSLKRRAGTAVPMTPETRYNDMIAIVGGLVIYIAIILGLHAVITGVALIR